MRRITKENISKEIEWLLDNEPMTCATLEKFVLLCKAMKYMGHVHREFTEEDAREWVSHMEPPARWTMDQTTAVMHQKGYNHRPCEFWAVMNSLYSDYGYTLAKHNVDHPEVWAEMAHDWLADPDAGDGKAGRYWRDVVMHHVDNM